MKYEVLPNRRFCIYCHIRTSPDLRDRYLRARADVPSSSKRQSLVPPMVGSVKLLEGRNQGESSSFREDYFSLLAPLAFIVLKSYCMRSPRRANVSPRFQSLSSPCGRPKVVPFHKPRCVCQHWVGAASVMPNHHVSPCFARRARLLSPILRFYTEYLAGTLKCLSHKTMLAIISVSYKGSRILSQTLWLLHLIKGQ